MLRFYALLALLGIFANASASTGQGAKPAQPGTAPAVTQVIGPDDQVIKLSEPIALFARPRLGGQKRQLYNGPVTQAILDKLDANTKNPTCTIFGDDKINTALEFTFEGGTVRNYTLRAKPGAFRFKKENSRIILKVNLPVTGVKLEINLKQTAESNQLISTEEIKCHDLKTQFKEYLKSVNTIAVNKIDNNKVVLELKNGNEPLGTVMVSRTKLGGIKRAQELQDKMGRLSKDKTLVENKEWLLMILADISALANSYELFQDANKDVKEMVPGVPDLYEATDMLG